MSPHARCPPLFDAPALPGRGHREYVAEPINAASGYVDQASLSAPLPVKGAVAVHAAQQSDPPGCTPSSECDSAVGNPRVALPGGPTKLRGVYARSA